MLKNILEKSSNLKVCEQRCSDDDYSELVFYKQEIDEWDKLFSDALGPAVKPCGVKPTREDSKLTEPYGGIFSNQVLYKKEFDGGIVIAMFWPWQDNEHVTLKLAFLKK